MSMSVHYRQKIVFTDGKGGFVEPYEKGKWKHSLKFVESFKGKNVLVTGATGAIGSKVCKKLLKVGVNRLVKFVKNIQKVDQKI